MLVEINELEMMIKKDPWFEKLCLTNEGNLAPTGNCSWDSFLSPLNALRKESVMESLSPSLNEMSQE